MAGRLASVLNWLGAQTLEALSPTRCAGCEAPGQLVCSGCLERLELIDPAWACARCGAPFGRMLCTECYGRTMATDRCLAVAVFQDPLARMIRMYKDAGERRLAEPFAEMLYDAALHAQAEDAERFSGLLARADALVFVPATARAFRRRGFDHMEAIARVLAELSGVPVLDALVKHGAGDQRAWGRLERLMRSHGAYEVVPDAFGALAGARGLVDIGGDDARIQPGLAHELDAAGRLGCQDHGRLLTCALRHRTALSSLHRGQNAPFGMRPSGASGRAN